MNTIELIPHAHDDCTGEWRLRGSGESRAIYCPACKKAYPYTRERARTATNENYAGIYLRRLTNQGAAILKGGAA